MPVRRTKKVSPSNTNSPLSRPTPVPRLLRICEAAHYLGATIWQVRTLTWSKKLPALKLGNRYLYDRVDLDNFVDRVKSEAARP